MKKNLSEVFEMNIAEIKLAEEKRKLKADAAIEKPKTFGIGSNFTKKKKRK